VKREQHEEEAWQEVMTRTKWDKRRVSNLQMTIDSVRLNTNSANSDVLGILEEWASNKGLTQEERDALIEKLTDAKIQIDIALEDLERP
jgi:hypothetical protein